MAGLRRSLLSGNILSSIPKAFRRKLAVNSPTFKAVAAYDHANPAPLDRVENDDSLSVKERGSWIELTRDDKIELYRSQFPQTMVESNTKPPEGGRIFFGITSLLSISLVFYVFLNRYVGPTPPITVTKEWKQAQKEKMKLYRMNPITGISSNK